MQYILFKPKQQTSLCIKNISVAIKLIVYFFFLQKMSVKIIEIVAQTFFYHISGL